MVDRLSTGIDSLDRRLDGGFERGSLVALVTPPAAQSHAVIHQLMAERPNTYVTTLRSAAAIENELRGFSGGELAVTVEEVGEAVSKENEMLHRLSGSKVRTINTTERDQLLDELYDVIERMEGVKNLIVDPVNPLERCEDRSAYQKLLKQFSSQLLATGGLGLLHCTVLEDPPAFRESTLTIADVVWELNIVSGRKDNLEIQTRIPKNRGGEAVLEKVSLILRGDEVYTDDSRNI